MYLLPFEQMSVKSRFALTAEPPRPPVLTGPFSLLMPTSPLRLAQDHPPSNESEMARLFRHSIKNELNALGLGARCLLQDDELGRTHLSDEGRAFLVTIAPLVERLVSVVDQVRRLPVQPLEPQAQANARA